ncbi:MAG: hypothetical protein LJE65_17425 [Desulfobacteraceae bacterium]|nr:hypothetical protein [Desulfobacteraceae bacterium]
MEWVARSQARPIIAAYCKYAYWLQEEDARRLQHALTKAGRKVAEPKRAVCASLSRRIQVGIVAPDVWKNTELCKRPLTWYWHSPLAGRFLIVSTENLSAYGHHDPIRLRSVKFRPPRLPDDAQMRRLITSHTYIEAKPDAWDQLEKEDPAVQERWMRVMGIRGKTFRELFVSHCANHANFIEPVFFIREEEETVPYSIGKSAEICSACLEFFNVIGGRFRKKLVVPCPGAVIYAGLPVNRYIEVLSPAAEDPMEMS